MSCAFVAAEVTKRINWSRSTALGLMPADRVLILITILLANCLEGKIRSQSFSVATAFHPWLIQRPHGVLRVRPDGLIGIYLFGK